MHSVALFVESQTRFTRIEQAIQQRYSVRRCLDWAQVRLSLTRAQVSTVIFEPTPGQRMDFDMLRDIRALAPRVGLVLWAHHDTPRTELFDVGRLGIDALIVPGENDTPQGVHRVLERLQARSAAALLQPYIGDMPRTVRDVTLVSVIRAHEDLSPQRLAGAVGLGRRALANHLAESNMPSPHQLLTWGRLVVAASLLEAPHRTADSVANDLGFASPSGFRNLCKRYLGATPADIRTNGGAEWVVSRLFAEDRPDRLTPGMDDEGDDLSAVESAEALTA